MFILKILRWEGYLGLPRWTLNAITRILRRGRRGGGRFDTEEKMQPQRQRSEWHDHKPRDAGSRERLEEAKDDGFSPEASRRNTALLTRWFWLSDTDFGPLASKIVRINFCALKKYSLINIYLALLGLSWGTQNLCCIMQDVSLQGRDSLVVALGLSHVWA